MISNQQSIHLYLIVHFLIMAVLIIASNKLKFYWNFVEIYRNLYIIYLKFKPSTLKQIRHSLVEYKY